MNKFLFFDRNLTTLIPCQVIENVDLITSWELLMECFWTPFRCNAWPVWQREQNVNDQLELRAMSLLKRECLEHWQQESGYSLPVQDFYSLMGWSRCILASEIVSLTHTSSLFFLNKILTGRKNKMYCFNGYNKEQFLFLWRKRNLIHIK